MANNAKAVTVGYLVVQASRPLLEQIKPDCLVVSQSRPPGHRLVSEWRLRVSVQARHRHYDCQSVFDAWSDVRWRLEALDDAIAGVRHELLSLISECYSPATRLVQGDFHDLGAVRAP